MIHIKTPDEIVAMGEGGQILRRILHELALAVKVGMTTDELNLKAEALIEQYGVAPSFKGYRGFPKVICTSINEEVVHAIPGKRIINDGDIISIDGGVIHKGFHTDCAITVLVGNVKPEIKRFVQTAQKALGKAISIIKPGVKTEDLGFAIQQIIESGGYSVVRDFIGHGVGRALHEDPPVPNFGKKGKGALLLPGMVIAIEPIVAMGERFTEILKDGWTVITRDNSIACQVEHTIAITKNGAEVLTKYNNTINNIYPQ